MGFTLLALPSVGVRLPIPILSQWWIEGSVAIAGSWAALQWWTGQAMHCNGRGDVAMAGG